MADVDIAKLLEPHKSALKELAQDLAGGDRAKLAGGLAALAAAIAAGNPALVALAPLASKGVARAFGNAADEMLRKELACMEAEEERQAFAALIVEPIEALIGQALIQLVRVQHNVKDELRAEVLDALGGLREDLDGFRARFAQELGGVVVEVDLQTVRGGIGIRVGPATRQRVFVARMDVTDGIGIDLA